MNISPASMHRSLSAAELIKAYPRKQANLARSMTRREVASGSLARDATRGALVGQKLGQILTLPADIIFGTGQPTGHIRDVGVIPALLHAAAVGIAAMGALVGVGVGMVGTVLALPFGLAAARHVGLGCVNMALRMAWEGACVLRTPIEMLSNLISLAVRGGMTVLGATLGVLMGLPLALSRMVYFQPSKPRNSATIIEMEPIETIPADWRIHLASGNVYYMRELEAHFAAQKRWTEPLDNIPLEPDDIARIVNHPSRVGQHIAAMVDGGVQPDLIQDDTLNTLHRCASIVLNDRTAGHEDTACALVQMRQALSSLSEQELSAANRHLGSSNGGSLSERLDEVLRRGSCTRLFARELAEKVNQMRIGRLDKEAGKAKAADDRHRVTLDYVAGELFYLFGIHVGVAKETAP